MAGDQSGAFDETVWIVESLIDEAKTLLESDRREAPFHAQDALENALKTLRTISKPERAARRLLHLDAKIETSIDDATAQAARMLTALPLEETDLTEQANRVRDLVRGRRIEEGIHVLLRPTPVANYENIRGAVADALKGSALSLFPTIHLSLDGRIAAHTGHSSDAHVFGVPSDVWQMMMQVYERRINLLVVRRILPAWETMSTEHKFSVADFHAFTRRSPIIPAGREYSVATALAHGYNGDFFTAAQLLAPQVENLVRDHLANAGAITRSYEGGIQNDIGLSKLMERDEGVTIFGPDVAFEIRALFCSALGPNLRNEYAHGLVGDWGRGSRAAVYAWWLVWNSSTSTSLTPSTTFELPSLENQLLRASLTQTVFSEALDGRLRAADIFRLRRRQRWNGRRRPPNLGASRVLSEVRLRRSDLRLDTRAE